jgi:serine protease Do
MARLPRWVLALLVVALASLPGVIVALVMTAGGAPAPLTRLESPPEPRAPLPRPDFARDGAVSLAEVAAHAAPSVVRVFSTATPPRGTHPFLDPVPPGRGHPGVHGQGAGVIIDADGLVLTSSHVVAGADAIRVTLDDDRRLRARVVGADPPTDLALLRIEGEPEGLVPLEFGDSGRLRRADVVLAIGNPFGVGQAVTMGIVSALGRADLGIVDYEDFIQTDAAVNPGSSGGPLVDMEGRLVGINTAILSRSGGYQGIAFAVPSNMARAVVDSLMEHGRVIRGWLGVAIQDLSDELAEALGVTATDGVVVVEVVPDGPAHAAGMERGDVILRFDGDEVASSGQLRNDIAMRGAGVTVSLEVARGDAREALQVKLGELPQEKAPPLPDWGRVQGSGGLGLVALDDDARSRFDIPPEVSDGVVVGSVEPGSPAARAGLREGDVIVELGRAPVRSVGEAIERLRRSRGKVLVRAQRGRAVFFTVLAG